MTLLSTPPGVENCSCPKTKKDKCPMNKRCLDKNIVYMATISTTAEDCKYIYVGATSRSFKERYAVQKQSFKDRNLNQTTLSKTIWDLRDQTIDHTLTFKTVGRGQPYSPKFKKCGLCIKEKTLMITMRSTLNKRNEITAKCPHRDKHLLYKVN